MSTVIEVTQEDIDKADELRLAWEEAQKSADLAVMIDEVIHPDRCPVALAATRAFGTPMRVAPKYIARPEPGEREVMHLHFKRRGFDQSGDIALPELVSEEIRSWDDEGTMDPIRFEVDA